MLRERSSLENQRLHAACASSESTVPLQVEDLLEGYFMNLSKTGAKLKALAGYIAVRPVGTLMVAGAWRLASLHLGGMPVPMHRQWFIRAGH